MRPQPPQSGSTASRHGFTMVEMLVVLMIVAILLSISFVVYGQAVESARIQATRATIRQLDSVLQQRLEAFRRINLRPQAQQFKARYDSTSGNPPGTVPLPLEIAEIVVRKDRFRAAFPQRLEDLWGLDGQPDTPDDAPLWRIWRRRTQSTPPYRSTVDPLESSELLLLTLTSGGTFGGVVLPLDRLNSDHVRDANGNSLPEIYDAWGNPLRFYNWPTRLVRPGGETSSPPSVPIQYAPISGSQFRGGAQVLIPTLPRPNIDPLPFDRYSHPLNQDPDDPTGALVAAQNQTGFARNPFQLGGTAQQPLDERFFGTFDTYSVPLIVSAGPDSRLGLTEPSLPGAAPERLAQPTGNADQLYDNITNHQP